MHEIQLSAQSVTAPSTEELATFSQTLAVIRFKSGVHGGIRTSKHIEVVRPRLLLTPKPKTIGNWTDGRTHVGTRHTDIFACSVRRVNSAVQGPASGGMNIGGGGPVQGRKRKLDSPPPDSPSSASPDEDSSGGDGTSCTSLQLTPSKVLSLSLCLSLSVHDCMTSWVVLRHLGTDTLGGSLGTLSLPWESFVVKVDVD